jgi:hypothetical protein
VGRVQEAVTGSTERGVLHEMVAPATLWLTKQSPAMRARHSSIQPSCRELTRCHVTWRCFGRGWCVCFSPGMGAMYMESVFVPYVSAQQFQCVSAGSPGWLLWTPACCAELSRAACFGGILLRLGASGPQRRRCYMLCGSGHIAVVVRCSKHGPLHVRCRLRAA